MTHVLITLTIQHIRIRIMIDQLRRALVKQGAS